MLMNSRVPAGAAEPWARRVAARIAALAGAFRQLSGAIQRRRDAAALAQLDDRTLADIGLAPGCPGEMIEPQSWRAATGAPPTRAGAARSKGLTSRIRRWRLGEDKNRRALAELDDGELSNLSELGLQIRREARRETKTR
jgi:uncharacterized protein YjiS (DUF1127 family)